MKTYPMYVQFNPPFAGSQNDGCHLYHHQVQKVNRGQTEVEKVFLMDYFPGGSDAKESACNGGALGLIPGSGKFPGEGNGNPLQYSCLENPMDRGVWRAMVHCVTKSWTRLNDNTFTF